jgi:hypothetical protein
MTILPSLVLSLAFVLGTPLEVNASNSYIAALARCESNFRSDIVVMDTNHKISVGLVQFQQETFRTFGEQYGLIPSNLSDSELLLLMKRPTLQKTLAEKMLTDGGERHWYTCGYKALGKFPVSK